MSIISKSTKNVTQNAKNVVYAVVGAGDAAVKGAKDLPKRARNIGSFASGIVRDASKRFDRYVVRGRKLVGRNGSKPKAVRAPKAKATETVVPPVVETRSSEIPADVLG